MRESWTGSVPPETPGPAMREGRSQNAECKSQKTEGTLGIPSDFCILHFDFCISHGPPRPARRRIRPPTRVPCLRAKNLPCPRRRLRRPARGRPTPRSPLRGPRPSADPTNTPTRSARSGPPAKRARGCCPGATPEEIALLGPDPRSGLSLFAGGLDWQPGDEVIYNPDDYPANVYPWTDLARRGGGAACVAPGAARGEYTPDLIENALTPRTRLVALASAFFRQRLPPRPWMPSAKCSTRAGCCFPSMPSRRWARCRWSVEHVDFLSARRA